MQDFLTPLTSGDSRLGAQQLQGCLLERSPPWIPAPEEDNLILGNEESPSQCLGLDKLG